MQRLLGLFLIVPLTACTPGRAAIVAGAGTMVYGALAVGAGAATTAVFSPIADGAGDAAVYYGVGFLVAGALIAGLGLVAESKRDEHRDAPPVCAPCTASDPLLTAPPGIVEGTDSEGRGTVEDRTRINVRLAQQAISAAQRGQCEAANAAADRLALLAPETHEALLRLDPDVANCLSPR